MGKVFRFYLKKTDDIYEDDFDMLIPEDKYPLYAFTKDDKMADEFRSSRNMKVFVEISSKMSKDEYRTFANSKSSCALQMHTFQTCKNKFKNTWKEVEVVATWLEIEKTSQFIQDVIVELKEGVVKWNPEVLRESIQNAFGLLEYSTVYALGKTHHEAPAIMVDELAYFATNYKDILNFEVGCDDIL